MVDQVIVAEREPEDALAQQVGEGVRDEIGMAVIGEAGRQPLAEPDAFVGSRQQNHAAVRADRAAVESPHKFTAAAASKAHLALSTLCRHRGHLLLRPKSLSQKHFR